MAVGDRVRLRVRSLAAGGAGVADLPDGRVAFLHRTAPGELVEARVVALRKRWGEARVVARLEAAPTAVEPPCALYDVCGGCTLQHLAYEEQLIWKGRFVGDALRRIGGVDLPVGAAAPSPSTLRYRNRVTFTVRTLRGGRTLAGFHALGDPDRVVEVGGECLLPEPPITRCWTALREALAQGRRLLPASRELRVTVRSVGDGVVMAVRGGARGWDPEPLRAHVPGVLGVWHQADGEDVPTHVAGAPVAERWGEDLVPVAGHAFLQVNRGAAERLVNHVVALAGSAPARAVDAYCGVGVYGRALARAGWTVTGIEADAEGCRAARQGAPAGFTVVEGRVESRLETTLPADLVILNPPRAGLHEAVPRALASRPPARLVYVSCDPATLARDVARMQASHRITAVRPFDLFPQTSHVETVALLSAAGDDR